MRHLLEKSTNSNNDKSGLTKQHVEQYIDPIELHNNSILRINKNKSLNNKSLLHVNKMNINNQPVNDNDVTNKIYFDTETIDYIKRSIQNNDYVSFLDNDNNK